MPLNAVQGKNGSDQNKYTGPAPPTGIHRYIFQLYELSDMLALDENATKREVQTNLEPILLNAARLVGTYQRENQQ